MSSNLGTNLLSEVWYTLGTTFEEDEEEISFESFMKKSLEELSLSFEKLSFSFEEESFNDLLLWCFLERFESLFFFPSFVVAFVSVGLSRE